MGKILRRTFLFGSAAVAGGFAVGWYMYTKPYPNPLEAKPGEGVFTPFIRITSDDTVTMVIPRAEMGQGMLTTLAAMIAEELDVDLATVQTEFAPAAKAYYNSAMLEEGAPFPAFDNSFVAETMRGLQGVVAKFLAMQATGGSSSTVDAFDKLRQAGAGARLMLVHAAADEWGVAAASLRTENGKVIDPALGKSLSYGALAEKAAQRKVPSDVALKPREQWRYLGKTQPKLDMEAKVTGKAQFGIDVRLPDMLFATVRMNPRQGAAMTAMDDGPALAMPGVVKVVNLGTGYAVIAGNTWTAMKAADAIKPQWAQAPYPATTEGVFAKIEEALASGEGFAMRSDGETPADAAARGESIKARYSAPYLAHACMEPMNATAQWAGDRLTIWCGNQAPTSIVQQAAAVFSIPAENVEVVSTYLGGGFGRRFETDFSILAARVAKDTDGKPVQVAWTREEDMRHDMYRPGALCDAEAVLGSNGIEAISFRSASQSVMASAFGRLEGAMTPPGPDKLIVDGLWDQPYDLANFHVTGVPVDLAIPVGFWRAVGHSFNPFFIESFMDEIAAASRQDPLEMRLKLMANHAPAVGVLEAVKQMSGWDTPLDAAGVKSRGRGVAFCLSFGSWVAQVIQVADTDAGIRIENVWCAADVGIALDPGNLEAQMMSGIVYGLSAAMGEEITFADGMAEQGNFDSFDAMRMGQCPVIEVRILENSPKMGGAGEPGTPPSLPALANAIFAATGKRVRKLPLSSEVGFA
ncbi:MAG: xanthine dehydrogenase family protein molybdopterin-binding subunit [Anderseniella sp.]|jgi:isoquinoline 1-oxidoreductase beta subunit|nr:xanthine dehydrogenase family protein molybdopterin-binding subunit [Anderseniella sp.]